MVTFEQNNLYILRELERQQIPVSIVFIYNGKNKAAFDRRTGMPSIPLHTVNPVTFIQTVYHLATSKKIILDNYYGILAVLSFKKSVECVQVWHAAGAIKTFGFEDLSIQGRPKRAFRRFQSVYNHFHKIVVGSDLMAERFLKAFHLPEHVILRTGVPRTDLFFNQQAKAYAIQKLKKLNPLIGVKKVILYAPTYRDQELDTFKLELDLKKMQEALAPTHLLILKLHPAIKEAVCLTGLDEQFVMDCTGKYEINDLLFITDLLITDYSSITYEFSIFQKPMLFFAYDELTYLGERGLWESYSKMVPGPIVRTTEEIITAIKEEHYRMDEVLHFSQTWNRYSKGHSSRDLVDYLFFEKENVSLLGKDH